MYIAITFIVSNTFLSIMVHQRFFPEGDRQSFISITKNGRIKFLLVFSSSDLRDHVGMSCQRFGGTYCLRFKGRGITFLRKAESRLSYSNSVSQITETQHEPSPASPSVMIHYEIYDTFLLVNSCFISFTLVDMPYNFED